MKPLRPICATVGGALILAGSAYATTPTGITGPKAPSAAHVRAAIKRAERSTGLWATINICNTKRHRNTVGIRAQMPALGFPASLQMIVRLRYYSTATANFKPVPNATVALDLGQASRGYHQDGVTFTVRPPATLNASVEFVWRSGSKVLGELTQSTVSGRKGVQQADPPGHSAAVCRIS